MSGSTVTVDMRPGEAWWVGNVAQGHLMPLGESSKFEIDLYGDTAGNQSQPVLLSSHGRAIWCDEPITIRCDVGRLTVSSRSGQVRLAEAGNSLRDAHRHLVENVWEFGGTIPERALFDRPQFNTWIELTYNQNQQGILEYAQGIIDHGYEPGVLMIDDTWQENYGDWRFSARRFSDPVGMMKRLRDMGFIVLLWVCPFVSADSPNYRQLSREGGLLRDPLDEREILWAHTNKHPAIVRWWNGASGLLDLSDPKGQAWFRQQLDRLRQEYAVTGFKFDAGDANFYTGNLTACERAWTPNRHTEAFARFAAEYPYTELRACWKLGGWPIAQRLRDKGHNWEDLALLIPHATLSGLLGYPYNCPDMIGGGEYWSFQHAATIDQELFVRSAQCSALMPMMQFSAAPWRVLDAEHAALCRQAAQLHGRYADRIIELALNASRSGEPIVRSMVYEFPDLPQAAAMHDQFMLGPNVLVAPVLVKGAAQREVIFPPGTWTGDRGERFVGPSRQIVDAPLNRLPHFTRR